MKPLFLLTCVLMSTLSLNAQEQSRQAMGADSITAKSTMARAIEQTTFATETTPNPQAAFYMFLHSASWCGACHHTLPKIIAEYAKMQQENRLEIILISHDYSIEKLLRYVNEADIPFATLWYKANNRKSIPGAAENVIGIPCIIVTDAHGNVVHRGHASSFIHWKTFTSNH